MKKISKAFAQRVVAHGVLDTIKYRYVNVPTTDGSVIIDRIAGYALGTAEARHSQSDSHPDGWENVYYAMATR